MINKASTRPDLQDLDYEEIRGYVTQLSTASTQKQLAIGLGVSGILHKLGIRDELAAAAALYPMVQAGSLSEARLAKDFGGDITGLVKGVLSLPDLSGIDLYSAINTDPSENLRRMLFALVKDVRVIIIRLAIQLHELRNAKQAPEETKRQLATQARQIYAPLANRLGIWQLKWELEDLAFRFLDPDTYHQIAHSLKERRTDREQYINEVIESLGKHLRNENIVADIKGRPKHIYSIWRKMQRKQVHFDKVHDVRAIRVLVDTVTDCYAALGVVHALWRHIPKEFDDYIATPKENEYRSLHTAVIGPHNKPLEIQIRTHEMNQHAELGVAAHWRYKEGVGPDTALEHKISWIRKLLEAPETTDNDEDFIDRFKAEIFEDRIYVLTPNGAVIDLPVGATAVDFAYHIHTDIGHRCRGARVNGRIVSLNSPLTTGDQVEIMTIKYGGPSRDWLIPQNGFVASSRARSKIRHWFRQQNHDRNLAEGKTLVDKELNKLGIDIALEKLAAHFSKADAESMLVAVGAGDISMTQIANALQQLSDNTPKDITGIVPLTSRTPKHKVDSGIQIQGVGNLLTHLARCCQPVPPDPITGFITRGRGVTIHREDCGNVLRLKNDAAERLIEVQWGSSPSQTYALDAVISAYDRPGLLRDISNLFALEKINVVNMHLNSDRQSNTVEILLTLEVVDLEQFSRVLSRIQQLPNVIESRRRV